MGPLQRVTVALRTVIGVANRGIAMPSRRGVRRTRHHAAAVVLETLEDRTLLSASSSSAGLVPTAGISPAAEVASQVSTGRPARLAKIETLGKLAYIWGLPAESVYRFSRYNQLVTAPFNTLAYNSVPAAWNNAATNAGNASVLYFYAALDLTRTTSFIPFRHPTLTSRSRRSSTTSPTSSPIPARGRSPRSPRTKRPRSFWWDPTHPMRTKRM